jgi:hypothetical protein
MEQWPQGLERFKGLSISIRYEIIGCQIVTGGMP